MNKIFALLLFLVTSLTFSQEVLVPFRVGDKFGLSDLKGKMKLEAKYDWLDVETDNVFVFTKGSSSGVISGVKELLMLDERCKYNVVKDKFIIATVSRIESGVRINEAVKQLYNFQGQNLIKEQPISLAVTQSFGITTPEKDNVFIFRALSREKLETFYVYDSAKQKVTDILLEGSKYINVVNKDFASNQMSIVRTTVDGANEKYVIEYKDGKVLLRSAVINETKTGSRRSDEIEEKIVEIREGDGMGYDLVPDITKGESVERLPKINNYNTMLTLDGKTITATYKGYYSQKEIISKKVKLPANSTDVTLGHWLQTFHSPGKSHNVYNYVTYSVNGKKGLLITDTLHITPKYDELTLVKFKRANSDLPAIIVGNKDAGGTMKYGIINENGETLVSVQYDKIDYLEDETYSRGKSVKTLEDNLLVKRGGLFGIINYKNVEILPVKYTDITKRSNSYATTYTLRNGDKYGILKYQMNKKTEFADALFPYPVTFVLKDYAGSKGIDMVLLEKNDKIFCYARPDGFIYYKT